MEYVQRTEYSYDEYNKNFTDSLMYDVDVTSVINIFAYSYYTE